MSTLIENNKKTTTQTIKTRKNSTPITMITAYDALFAKIFDGMVDIILVGDSLEMSFNGRSDTLAANFKDMIYHTKAVCATAQNSLIVMDMPFGSYSTKKQALKNAVKVYRKTNAQAIKIEGGCEVANIVKHLTLNKIAVMGHIGLLPQTVRQEGGYKTKGKIDEQVKQLLNDAKAIEEAGAFCIVIEGVCAKIAKRISQSIKIPTIGIGAGVDVDGQVLVWSDAFGFFNEFKPKFVKRYLDGASLVKNALQEYVNDVKSKKFPDERYSY